MTACTCNCLKNKKKVFRGSDSLLSKWSLYVGQMAIILCEVLQQLGYSWSFFLFSKRKMMKLVLDPIVRKNENLLDAYRTT